MATDREVGNRFILNEQNEGIFTWRMSVK